MSRIGKLPINLPAGVTVAEREGVVEVKGPKGQLSQGLVQGVSIQLEDGVLSVLRDSEARKIRANHGLMRALLANMVTGVSEGFERWLEIQGIGYGAEIKGADLVLNLGYSHPVIYKIPDGLQITIDGPTRIRVHGIDKQLVGEAAATIRKVRPPDSYKGKGVRYRGEYVKLKAGKSAA